MGGWEVSNCRFLCVVACSVCLRGIHLTKARFYHRSGAEKSSLLPYYTSVLVDIHTTFLRPASARSAEVAEMLMDAQAAVDSRDEDRQTSPRRSHAQQQFRPHQVYPASERIA